MPISLGVALIEYHRREIDQRGRRAARAARKGGKKGAMGVIDVGLAQFWDLM